MDISSQILSDIVVHMKYARYDKKKKRRETWEEIVTRNKQMMLRKYPKLKEEIEHAYQFVYDKKVLPSMRGLQFGGKAIEKNPARIFNCCALSMSHPAAFSELSFLLMSGCGVGYSVQRHHVEELPEIYAPKKTRRFLVPDSIDGWAEAVGALVESYLGGRKSKPQFDFSDIREQGTPLKTSGGMAPGPEPLKDCLHNIEKIFDRKKDGEKLTPIEVNDICCFIADCVVVGGTRRSACIAVFSFDDSEMVESKYNSWYVNNPQRGRANNSALILRHKITEEEFEEFFKKIQLSKSGEPGFILSNNPDVIVNPCVEISLRTNPRTGTGSMCNLVEINGGFIQTQEEFDELSKIASFIGTLQAGYTDFHFLREEWQELVEKEALIGVGITGITTGNVLNLNMKQAAKEVVKENERVADIIGINVAARCTTVKPAGTSSIVLGCSSGIHSWFAPYYIRRVRVGKDEAIYKYLAKHHPELVEDDYFKSSTQAVISVPIKAPEEAITRKETALQFLERIKKVYKNWVVTGHRKGYNTNNISATVYIKEHEWERVCKWMWDNRDSYTALSLFPHDEHTHMQAPFEEIDKEKYEEMFKTLKKVDLTKVVEEKDETTLQSELACSGDSCEVK